MTEWECPSCGRKYPNSDYQVGDYWCTICLDVENESVGSERTECWRCGYMRLIYESCPKCGGSCKPLTVQKQKADSDYKTEHLHGYDYD